MVRIALPIGSKVRELDAKVWLALNLVNNGHKVALGRKGDIRYTIDIIKPDIYFEKSGALDPKRLNRMTKLSKVGTKVFILDEEGGVFPSEQFFVSHRLSPDVLKNADRYLAWGNAIADIVRNNRDFPDEKIEITGHPRFDLLNDDLRKMYKKKAKLFQNEYNEYVLVTTSFARANNKRPELIKRRKEEREYNIDDEDINHQQNILNAIIGFVKEFIKNNQNTTVIIRPHPSENFITYKNEFSSTDKVFVIHEGDVRPWILGAKAVVHNNSTTGIESALLNVPVYSYHPFENKKFDSELPAIVSNKIKSESNLINELKKVNKKQKYTMDKQQTQQLKQYIYNLDKLAVDRICTVVEGTKIDTRSNFQEFGSKKKKIERKFKNIPGSSKLEGLLGTKGSQRFPKLSAPELSEVIENYNSFIKTEQIKIEEVTPWKDAYWLYKKK